MILKLSKYASLWTHSITMTRSADFVKFPKNFNIHSDGDIMTYISSKYMNIGSNKLSIWVVNASSNELSRTAVKHFAHIISVTPTRNIKHKYEL